MISFPVCIMKQYYSFFINNFHSLQETFIPCSAIDDDEIILCIIVGDLNIIPEILIGTISIFIRVWEIIVLSQDNFNIWIFIHIHGGDIEASSENLLKEKIRPEEICLGRSRGHHEDFLNAVRTRGQVIAPAEVGHRSVSICHLVNIAMLTGRKLHWDPAKEVIINDSEASRMLSRPMRSPWYL